MLQCIIVEKDPPVTAQSGPWEKLDVTADGRTLVDILEKLFGKETNDSSSTLQQSA